MRHESVGYPPETFGLNAASQQAAGLVAWWPAAGSPLSYGVERTGCAKAITWAAPVNPMVRVFDPLFGPGLQFSGTNNGAMDLVPALTFTQASSFSLSAWVYKDTDVTVNRNIFRSDPGGSKRSLLGFRTLSGTGKLNFLIGNTNYTLGEVTGNTNIAGTRCHVVAVRDVVLDKLYIYLNGREDASATDPSTGTWALTNLWKFGAYEVGSETERWTGAFGDLRVYNRALSAAEVAALYAPATRWELYESARRGWTAGLTVPAFNPAWAVNSNVIIQTVGA